ncbi:hypothetical protein B484DRAFT_481628, partial [Ochromonadaceae sp. CCMP2298]
MMLSRLALFALLVTTRCCSWDYVKSIEIHGIEIDKCEHFCRWDSACAGWTLRPSSRFNGTIDNSTVPSGNNIALHCYLLSEDMLRIMEQAPQAFQQVGISGRRLDGLAEEVQYRERGENGDCEVSRKFGESGKCQTGGKDWKGRRGERGRARPAAPTSTTQMQALITSPVATDSATLLNFPQHFVTHCSYSISMWVWLRRPHKLAHPKEAKVVFSTTRIPVHGMSIEAPPLPAIIYNTGREDRQGMFFFSLARGEMGDSMGVWLGEVRYHQWMHLTLSVRGNVLSAYLDGELLGQMGLGERKPAACPYNMQVQVDRGGSGGSGTASNASASTSSSTASVSSSIPRAPHPKAYSLTDPWATHPHNTVLQVMGLPGGRHSSLGLAHGLVVVRNAALGGKQIAHLMAATAPPRLPTLARLLREYGVPSMEGLCAAKLDFYTEWSWGLCPHMVCSGVCVDEWVYLTNDLPGRYGDRRGGQGAEGAVGAAETAGLVEAVRTVGVAETAGTRSQVADLGLGLGLGRGLPVAPASVESALRLELFADVTPQEEAQWTKAHKQTQLLASGLRPLDIGYPEEARTRDQRQRGAGAGMGGLGGMGSMGKDDMPWGQWDDLFLFAQDLFFPLTPLNLLLWLVEDVVVFIARLVDPRIVVKFPYPVVRSSLTSVTKFNRDHGNTEMVENKGIEGNNGNKRKTLSRYERYEMGWEKSEWFDVDADDADIDAPWVFTLASLLSQPIRMALGFQAGFDDATFTYEAFEDEAFADMGLEGVGLDSLGRKGSGSPLDVHSGLGLVESEKGAKGTKDVKGAKPPASFMSTPPHHLDPLGSHWLELFANLSGDNVAQALLGPLRPLLDMGLDLEEVVQGMRRQARAQGRAQAQGQPRVTEAEAEAEARAEQARGREIAAATRSLSRGRGGGVAGRGAGVGGRGMGRGLSDADCAVAASHYFPIAQYVISQYDMEGKGVGVLEQVRLIAGESVPGYGYAGEADTQHQHTEAEARDGNADAQTWLARKYYWGFGGLSPNPRLARRWFQKAAKQGDPQGMYNLGILYKNDIPRCMAHLSVAASNGHMRSLNFLSHALHDGDSWLAQYGREQQILRRLEEMRGVMFDAYGAASAHASASASANASTSTSASVGVGAQAGTGAGTGTGTGTDAPRSGFSHLSPIVIHLPEGVITLPHPLGSPQGTCQAALPMLKYLSEMSYRPRDLTRFATGAYHSKDLWGSLALWEEAADLGVRGAQENAAHLLGGLRDQCGEYGNHYADLQGMGKPHQEEEEEEQQQQGQLGQYGQYGEYGDVPLSAHTPAPTPNTKDCETGADCCRLFLQKLATRRWAQLAQGGEPRAMRKLADALLDTQQTYMGVGGDRG